MRWLVIKYLISDCQDIDNTRTDFLQIREKEKGGENLNA